MNKKSLLFKIMAMALFVVMLLSLASCGKKVDNVDTKKPTDPTVEVTRDAIKILADLTDYSKSANHYNAKAKTYDDTAKTYDGKDCSLQYKKLQYRIDKKTEDVYLGKTEAAVTKIFTKSTPKGILETIAKAALSYDEMVRTVNYIAGEIIIHDDDTIEAVNADVDSFVKEIEGERRWTGSLTGNSTAITLWVNAGEDGEDLNKGWSLFDDWDLYDRLKEYAKSSYNGLRENGKGKNKELIYEQSQIKTKQLAEDNASWQYRSILEKVYKPAKEGGVDLDGDAAARLATYMIEYATTVSEGMSSGTIADAASNGNTSDFSTYFRTKVALPANIPTDVTAAKAFWDPYAGLGDYDTLAYLLAFYDFRNGGYNNLPGLQSCVALYGYYYQYNRTYYNEVLADRPTYTKQLYYEKYDYFKNDADWLDYVAIQRNNYAKSYRYSDSFYQNFYKIHFAFQSKKESREMTVYPISNTISGHTYTGEMQKAIDSSKNGIKGQLAMSDWMWCYGASEANMKSYNKANTDYQKGKQQGAEAEYKGQFYYELEELKVAEYLFTKMTDAELSGALYYNCYGYSGSLISEMQNYSKDIVLITDNIKGWDKYTTIPDEAEIRTANEEAYAIGKLEVLRGQAKDDWDGTDVDTKAGNVSKQDWNGMRGEIKAARTYDYDAITADSQGEYMNVWKKRCDYLEDRVIARKYSCCDQRISEATKKCDTDHVKNPDGTAMTKEYDEKCAVSKFVSNYENILYYVAAKAKVECDTPTGNGYITNSNANATYTSGYYGNIADLISAAGNKKLSYAEEKTFTLSLGKSFQEEIIDDDGSDAKWWNENDFETTDVTKFIPPVSTEVYSATTLYYTYTYTFTGWYLDKNCKFLFNPEDDVDFNLVLYAGYDVKKEKNS